MANDKAKTRPETGETDKPKDFKEEIAFLRQKFSSLAIRGHYKECFKLIEDNIKLLYFKERWPENFQSSLTLHKRCFPSMDINSAYDDYLGNLLRKNGIPVVFVKLLRGGNTVAWTPEYFKEQALGADDDGNHEDALGYADLLIKMDPLSSNANLIKGWILQNLERDGEAAACFERSLELNRNNYKANSSLAELYAKTDPPKALELIEAAIEQMPGEAGFQAAKARILLRAGNREEAMAAYDQANLLDPLNADYIYSKAEILIADGQEIAAVRQYGKVLTVDEGHIPALTRLACLLADAQPGAALGYIGTVVNARPHDLDANILKARLLEKTGDTQAAIRQYKTVLELDPGSAMANGALGKLYIGEEPSRALPYYEKAAGLKPANAEYHIGKGRCHERMGDREAAIAAYKEAVARDKTSSRAYGSLGYLHMESDPKAALGYFNKAIGLSPENAYYHQAKGEILLKSPGQGKKALECFDSAVRFDPGNAQLRQILGSLLEEGGSIASAVEHYRVAVSLDNSLEETFCGLTRLTMDSEPDAALLYINSAINLNPQRAEYYYLKSRIYTRMGQDMELVRGLKQSILQDSRNIDAGQELSQLLDGNTPRVAMMYINRALEIMPENPTYLCARAEILTELGEKGKAMEQYRQAAKFDAFCHQAWYGMGRLTAERKGEDKKALEYLEKAIALAPGIGMYLAEKAKVLARDPFRYQEALACFDEALAIDKQTCDVVIAKARLLEEHGEYFEAIKHHKRALLIDRDCLEATARLGILLADLSPRASFVYLNKAVELEPDNYIHHIWRGRALHGMGEQAGAEAAVQEAIRLGGETDGLYFMLARILYKKLPEISLTYCELAAKLAPDKADYHLLRGNIYRRLGENELAMDYYAKALELDQGCHEAMARTAELLYRAGDPACLEKIEQAIAVNGGNATYHYIRGLILESLEESRVLEALGCIQEAVMLAPSDIRYREKLLELLKKSGSRLALFLEKRKLAKLRRALERAEAEATAAEEA